ncbi:hypothetical protein [Saccharomonospora sp.]|uniref:hypothetical protein n=1 Tax=Saccharomonospora sp. TaxID=33913 RepID=UPI00262A08F0|nr:hypothetical protein [Saccharomonospora sp.]
MVVAVRPAAFAVFPTDARRHSLLSSALRRLLLVLGLAVGGWVVSALLAGSASAEETSGTDLAHDTSAACADEATANGPRDRSDLTSCLDELADTENGTPATDPGTSPVGDHDTTSDDPATDSTGPTLPAETIQPAEAAEQAAKESDSTELPETSEQAGNPETSEDAEATEDTESAKPEGSEDSEDAEETEEPAERRPFGSQLLQATADTLLATTSELVHTTVHTTSSLTGMLVESLPQITGPLDDAIENVVDMPAHLPDVGPGLGETLPELRLPPLPGGLDDLDDLIGLEPDVDRPDDTPPGELRAEPLTPAEPELESPAAPAVPTPVSTTQLDQQAAVPTWSPPHPSDDTGANENPSRPFGPVAPSPSAPASVAGPSTSVASSQDNSHTHRSEHSVLNNTPTLTQLRLLGTSRDQDTVGAGKEAALPTTSPD